MTILIDPGTYNLANFGGVAMFRAAADRLREAIPGVRLRAFTESPASLSRVCPGVESVPHENVSEWVADRALLGPLQDRFPAPLKSSILAVRDRVAARAPGLVRGALRTRLRLSSKPTAGFDAFFAAVRDADAVVFTGGAGLNDEFPSFLKAFCTIVETAAGEGRPVALFGHAIGPLRPGPARRRLLEALRRLRIIGLRERVESPAYLREAGVDLSRVHFTGDDALEMALRHRPARLGKALGVNVRIAGYTGLGESALALLADVVARFRQRHEAPAVALPIAVHEAARDPEQIARVLGEKEPDPPADLSALLWRAGTCRAVVAGAYHAAVFALAQGVPVVALAQSPLYLAKFRGLQAEFGEGCRLVSLSEGPEKLAAELEEIWECAETLRPGLIAAAEGQARQGRTAYELFAKELA
jgi:colanic acid/amylovoran biosynthesis protein